MGRSLLCNPADVIVDAERFINWLNVCFIITHCSPTPSAIYNSRMWLSRQYWSLHCSYPSSWRCTAGLKACRVMGRTALCNPPLTWSWHHQALSVYNLISPNTLVIPSLERPLLWLLTNGWCYSIRISFELYSLPSIPRYWGLHRLYLTYCRCFLI